MACATGSAPRAARLLHYRCDLFSLADWMAGLAASMAVQREFFHHGDGSDSDCQLADTICGSAPNWNRSARRHSGTVAYDAVIATGNGGWRGDGVGSGV